MILSSCSSDDSLANKFNDFLMRKTAEIRDTTDADDCSMSETTVMDADVVIEGQPPPQLEPSTQMSYTIPLQSLHQSLVTLMCYPQIC